jgi:hypothetical protein
MEAKRQEQWLLPHIEEKLNGAGSVNNLLSLTAV